MQMHAYGNKSRQVLCRASQIVTYSFIYIYLNLCVKSTILDLQTPFVFFNFAFYDDFYFGNKNVLILSSRKVEYHVHLMPWSPLQNIPIQFNYFLFFLILKNYASSILEHLMSWKKSWIYPIGTSIFCNKDSHPILEREIRLKNEYN